MKYFGYILLGAAAFLCSCSNDEPKQASGHVRLASLVAADNSMLTFSYDKQGRITRYDGVSDGLREKALYSYPTSDRIVVDYSATDTGNSSRTVTYHEEFSITSGKALSSEGTYEMSTGDEDDILMKSFRRDYAYNDFSQLIGVKHTEIYGSGDFDDPQSWNQPWTWVNHIDWDNGNIVEFDDFMGSSTPRRISKYSYFADKADGNAVVLPSILERYSGPLMRAGVFGTQPANLLASEIVRDKDGELLSNRRFDYDFADGLVKSYYETGYSPNSASSSKFFEVNWTSY